MVPSVKTVVFTPDWKSNDTALGSGEVGTGRRLLRPLGAGSAPDGGSVFEAKVRGWGGSPFPGRAGPLSQRPYHPSRLRPSRDCPPDPPEEHWSRAGHGRRSDSVGGKPV